MRLRRCGGRFILLNVLMVSLILVIYYNTGPMMKTSPVTRDDKLGSTEVKTKHYEGNKIGNKIHTVDEHNTHEDILDRATVAVKQEGRGSIGLEGTTERQKLKDITFQTTPQSLFDLTFTTTDDMADDIDKVIVSPREENVLDFEINESNEISNTHDNIIEKNEIVEYNNKDKNIEINVRDGIDETLRVNSDNDIDNINYNINKSKSLIVKNVIDGTMQQLTQKDNAETMNQIDTQENTDGHNNQIDKQENTDGLNNQINTQENTYGLNNQIDTQENTDGHNNRRNTHENTDGHTRVLITTYMRSGSTYLGQLLGFRSDSFYLYEPLHNRPLTWSYYKDNGTLCNYQTNACKSVINTNTFSNTIEYLSDIYGCKLKEHTEEIEGKFHSNNIFSGPKWSVYRDCQSQGRNHYTCLQSMESVCRKMTNIVTKVLRMSLMAAETLLEKFPDLKLIHLLRDPRAVHNSRKATTWYGKLLVSPGLIEADIRTSCDRIRWDIRYGRYLLKKYPDRVKIVQYENFDQPEVQAQKIYKFLGMSYTKDVKQFVTKISKDKSEKGFHPFSYRHTLSWQQNVVLNKHCSDVYSDLGLVQFNTEADFRNEDISALTLPLPFSLD